MRQLSLALCLASALVVFAQPEETPPWRIVSITRNGFRPDAKRDRKGNVVFDGESPPYAEDREPAPVYEYGRWKADAEDYVRRECPSAAVIRNSLITSFAPPDARSNAMVAALRDGAPVTLFVDEIRTPILADDLARQIWEIARLPVLKSTMTLPACIPAGAPIVRSTLPFSTT